MMSPCHHDIYLYKLILLTTCHHYALIQISHHHNERIGDIMALRKEDFDYEDSQAETPKKRSRITIDVSPEMRRRIKMAAAQNDLSVGEYVGRILEENVPEEVN